MPYVNQDLRLKHDDFLREIDEMLDQGSKFEGELTYLIYTILLKYFRKHPSYSRIATIMGILSCTEKELYRREFSQYEDTKIIENGDI